MATIYIDDTAYEVEDGQNVLQAALNAGLDLPYFCWHPEMGSVGACRQCALVQYRDEEDTRGRIVMGCMTMVAEGARFSMQGESASEFRENVVESLMLNHPHDCPVCAEGGECHLQDMTVMVGHRDRRYRGKKNTHKNQNLGPLINHEMNRCIACYRCTRFYGDYAGGTDLAAHGAHDHVYFGRHEEGTLESEFAGNLVEVCPTGVFTDKPLVNDYTRKWDMQSAPSVCGGCAVGCNTIPSERYGELKRVHNRYNHQVNGYFLCDRGRYGHDYVNNESRPSFAGLKNSDGKYDAVSSESAIATLSDWIKAAGSKIAAIGSPRASLESNFLLKELVGADKFCTGFAEQEAALIQEIKDILVNGSVTTPSPKQVEAADAVLILGEDITNTAPRLALSLRQSIRNKGKAMAAQMRIPEWQDEAVRTLAQDQLSPLHSICISTTRLDDVAESKTAAAPTSIARLGFAIAQQIDSSLPEVSGLTESESELVKAIASDLISAEKPLLVSGTGAQSSAVIQAASAIAHALRNKEGGEGTMLSYCMPESNSFGSALLQTNENASLNSILSAASNGEIDTLIVLENDLYRRAAKEVVASALAGIKNLVVLDALPSATMEASSLVLPSATVIESEGTLVSNEGRAQRHYPVFLAKDERSPNWQWLTRIGQSLGNATFTSIKYFDDVEELCAAGHPALTSIVDAAPKADFRNRGLKIPRQTHRYSGRTAMRSNVALHEPKQPEDPGTPFSFSMEGSNSTQPGALLPFVWSPGWNSNQSLHKFQSEIGGELAGGTAGVRLIEARSASNLGRNYEVPDAANSNQDQLHLVPVYKIFGSEELSAQSEAVKELVSEPCVSLNSVDAARLGLVNGDAITINNQTTANFVLDDSLSHGCAAYSVGLPGTDYLEFGASVTLQKLNNGGANV